MTIATTTFYSSSNGDHWLLSHDDETGSTLSATNPLSSGGQLAGSIVRLASGWYARRRHVI